MINFNNRWVCGALMSAAGFFFSAAACARTNGKLFVRTDALCPDTVRFMTYNVRHGEGMDGVTDYDRTAQVISRSGARFVAVQEVDSVTGRSAGRDVLREIGDRCGLYPTFARAIAYDGGAYGVGILSDEKPLSVRRVPLPGREEARVLLVAEFSRFVMACTHLSLTEADGLASLPVIRAEAARTAKPFVWAGDWNALPESELLKTVSCDFTIVSTPARPTYPADVPVDCIDYMAVYKGTGSSVTECGSTVDDDAVASDHRAVSVTLLFK